MNDVMVNDRLKSPSETGIVCVKDEAGGVGNCFFWLGTETGRDFLFRDARAAGF